MIDPKFLESVLLSAPHKVKPYTGHANFLTDLELVEDEDTKKALKYAFLCGDSGSRKKAATFLRVLSMLEDDDAAMLEFFSKSSSKIDSLRRVLAEKPALRKNMVNFSSLSQIERAKVASSLFTRSAIDDEQNGSTELSLFTKAVLVLMTDALSDPRAEFVTLGFLVSFLA